jgi:DNA polymerase-1
LIPKGTDDWGIFTSEVNVPIQGGCADALKLDIIELYEVLPEGAFLVAALHDELIIEADAHRAMDILALAKGIMEKWASEMFSGVPMVVKGVICESWN